MKIYHKLLLGLFAILSIVGVASGVIYLKMLRIPHTLETLEGLNANSYRDLNLSPSIPNTLENLINIEISLTNSSQFSTIDAKYLKQSVDQWVLLRDQILNNIETLQNPELSQEANELAHHPINPQVNEKLKLIRQRVLELNGLFINLLNQDFKPTEELLSDQIQAIIFKINTLNLELTQLQSLIDNDQDSYGQQFHNIFISLQEAVKNLIKIFIITVLISLAVYLFVTYHLLNTISKPIARLQRATQALSEGDLGMIVQVDSDDEVGHLSMTFNNMVTRIKTMYDDLQNNIERLIRG
jgi:methyl-accepting chemotaxis protein